MLTGDQVIKVTIAKPGLTSTQGRAAQDELFALERAAYASHPAGARKLGWL